LPIPARIPPAAESVLRGLAWSRAAGRNPPEHWFTTIADAPRPGPVREEVMRLAALTLSDLPEPPLAAGSGAAMVEA
jgi:acetoin utilization protein AcuC